VLVDVISDKLTGEELSNYSKSKKCIIHLRKRNMINIVLSLRVKDENDFP